MLIIVGSGSARKIEIVRKVAGRLVPAAIEVVGREVASGVPETPHAQQTFDGSRNRAIAARQSSSDADYSVGLESGLVERYGHMYEEAWATVITKEGEEYYGYSSGLKVPDYILKKMGELKKEHSDVMTIIEKEFGNLPNDTWGTYSGGMIAREVSLEEALRNALIQIIAPEKGFYKK